MGKEVLVLETLCRSEEKGRSSHYSTIACFHLAKKGLNWLTHMFKRCKKSKFLCVICPFKRELVFLFPLLNILRWPGTSLGWARGDGSHVASTLLISGAVGASQLLGLSFSSTQSEDQTCFWSRCKGHLSSACIRVFLHACWCHTILAGNLRKNSRVFS